ncbi:MAG: hypothetical protein CMN78_03610 [Spirochaetales bacterium]|nr:hypothetical protein [Spirochaetales bacterium]
MRYSYALQGQESAAVVSFAIFTVAYGVYHFIFISEGIKRHFSIRWGDERGSFYQVLLSRGVFAALAAVVPIILLWTVFDISPAMVGLTFSQSNWSLSRTLLWVVIVSCIAGSILWFSRKTPRLLAAYPQMRLKRWSFLDILLNVVSWALYLFAYETMFRGYLLITIMPAGLWVAIAVNTALYVAVHLPKGFQESFGSAFYGPIVCVLSLESGTLWIVLVSHFAVAMANSFSNLRANSDMHFVFRREKRST